jgi:hypothetical protein
MSMSASWAVVATVDEPAPLVAAFVAHHLNEGAREVHLFLDKPDPETVALIRDMKGCKLMRCNKDHWAAHNNGTRPYLHTRRQIINANIAYAACRADWLVHCDADEFIRDGRAMAAELAEVPGARDHLRLRVSERVMLAGVAQRGLFDGVFRQPIVEEPRRLEAIYHPVEAFLDRGLTGHPNGKGVVRTGRGYKLNIHQPQGDVPSWPIVSTRLLHFDGLTEFHYLLKLLRRAHEKPLPGPPRHKSGRMAQLTAMKEHVGDPEFFRALLVGLKTLRPDQMAALTALGLIEEAAFRPNLGGLALDLGVAGFDAILRARQAEFLASIGFEG